MKQPMIDFYGQSYFEKTWHDWVDVFVKMSEGSGDGDTDLFTKVRCVAQSLHTLHFYFVIKAAFYYSIDEGEFVVMVMS